MQPIVRLLTSDDARLVHRRNFPWRQRSVLCIAIRKNVSPDETQRHNHQVTMPVSQRLQAVGFLGDVGAVAFLVSAILSMMDTSLTVKFVFDLLSAVAFSIIL